MPKPLPEAQNLTALLSILARENRGFIPFERFMEAALYHPQYGYYTQNVSGIGGREADFTTSPSLHPVFGLALRRWIEHMRQKLELEPPVHVIEIGGGSGALAQNVLKAFGMMGRGRVRYHIVEVSEPLRQLQKQRLRNRRVRWWTSPDDALEASNGKALIISNEVVDAFPCVLLQYRQDPGEWLEVGLQRHDDGSLTEDLRDPPWPRLRGAYPSILDVVERRDGQRVEIHVAYEAWQRKWLPLLERGALLTIDYGETVEKLYPRRLQGSVRAYYKHQRLTGPDVYKRFGKQDLTADVNFTDLKNWGSTAGLRNHSLVTQADFLNRAVPDVEKRAEKDPALQAILHPDGAGTAFKVLDQRKD
jgi:SAM-dependent MidA family methyltransferase